jgi:hypothetical protein
MSGEYSGLKLVVAETVLSEAVKYGTDIVSLNNRLKEHIPNLQNADELTYMVFINVNSMNEDDKYVIMADDWIEPSTFEAIEIKDLQITIQNVATADRQDILTILNQMGYVDVSTKFV